MSFAAKRTMRPLSAFAYASFSTLLIPATASTPSTCRSSPLILSSQQCSSYSTSSGPGRIAYRIAVSYCGKGRRVDPTQDVRTFDIGLLRAKGQTGFAGAPPRSGQDAFFMGSLGNGTGEDVAFGIADGVGGWMESGIDPSAFSEGLCRHMLNTAGGWEEEARGKLRSQKLLQAGYDGVLADSQVDGGGSTACVAIGRADGSFEVANLGDSGFAHYRPNATAFFSPPQIHAFNTPYQLSLIPEEMMRQYDIYGGQPLEDQPKDAAVSRHTVSHGDVLVFGTDGVWANLNSSDVLEIVTKEMELAKAWVVDDDVQGAVIGGYDLTEKTDWRRQSPDEGTRLTGAAAKERNLRSVQEKLAYRIVQQSQLASRDLKRTSPFGRELKRWYPDEAWHGGKVDDIAVIVAIVVDA